MRIVPNSDIGEHVFFYSKPYPVSGSVLTVSLFSQREGAFAEDDSADMDGENGTRFEEYEWCGQKRVRATTLLEGGFRGTLQ